MVVVKLERKEFELPLFNRATGLLYFKIVHK